VTSVQLYQTAFPVVAADGTVTLVIDGPRFNRTWQGTLSILGVPGGTPFAITVGAQAYGTLYAPGPGGPFQLLTGQRLVAQASGLTAGIIVEGILAGIDQPKEAATPWLGPTLVNSVALGIP